MPPLVTKIQSVGERRGGKFEEQRISTHAADFTNEGSLTKRLNAFSTRKQNEIRTKTVEAAQKLATEDAASIAARAREKAVARDSRKEETGGIGSPNPVDPDVKISLDNLEQTRDIAGEGMKSKKKEGRVFQTVGAIAYNQSLRTAFALESDAAFGSFLDMVELKHRDDPNEAVAVITKARDEHIRHLSEVAPDLVTEVGAKIHKSALDRMDTILQTARDRQYETSQDTISQGYETKKNTYRETFNANDGAGANRDKYLEAIADLNLAHKKWAETGGLAGISDKKFRETQDYLHTAYADAIHARDRQAFLDNYVLNPYMDDARTADELLRLQDKWNQYGNAGSWDLAVIDPTVAGIQTDDPDNPFRTRKWTQPAAYTFPNPGSYDRGGERTPGKEKFDNVIKAAKGAIVSGDRSEVARSTPHFAPGGKDEIFSRDSLESTLHIAAQNLATATDANRAARKRENNSHLIIQTIIGARNTPRTAVGADKWGLYDENGFRIVNEEGLEYFTMNALELQDLRREIDNWSGSAPIDLSILESYTDDMDARIELLNNAKEDVYLRGDVGAMTDTSKIQKPSAQWARASEDTEFILNQDGSVNEDATLAMRSQEYTIDLAEDLRTAAIEGSMLTGTYKPSIPGTFLEDARKHAETLQGKEKTVFFAATIDAIARVDPANLAGHIDELGGDYGEALQGMYQLRQIYVDPFNERTDDERYINEFATAAMHMTDTEKAQGGDSLHDVLIGKLDATAKKEFDADKKAKLATGVLGKRVYDALPDGSTEALARAFGLDPTDHKHRKRIHDLFGRMVQSRMLGRDEFLGSTVDDEGNALKIKGSDLTAWADEAIEEMIAPGVALDGTKTGMAPFSPVVTIADDVGREGGHRIALPRTIAASPRALKVLKHQMTDTYIAGLMGDEVSAQDVAGISSQSYWRVIGDQIVMMKTDQSHPIPFVLAKGKPITISLSELRAKAAEEAGEKEPPRQYRWPTKEDFFVGDKPDGMRVRPGIGARALANGQRALELADEGLYRAGFAGVGAVNIAVESTYDAIQNHTSLGLALPKREPHTGDDRHALVPSAAELAAFRKQAPPEVAELSKEELTVRWQQHMAATAAEEKVADSDGWNPNQSGGWVHNDGTPWTPEEVAAQRKKDREANK